MDRETAPQIPMNDVERAVLADLVENSQTDERYICFAGIQRRTGLSRDFVRAACMSLTDRGFATFSNALWTDDGEMAGSGYAATEAGAKAAASATNALRERSAALQCENERLRKLLADMTRRFRATLLNTGTDPEFADIAVAEAVSAIKKPAASSR